MVEPEGFRKLSSYENLVVRILKEQGSGCAADIAKILYPTEANLRPKISQVSVVLRRLEKKGVIKQLEKIGKRAVFTVVEEEAPSVKPPAEERPKKYEDAILEIIKEKEKVSASDIAKVMFSEVDAKKTALVSVYLKRLEAKKAVSRVEKIGRKAYYTLYKPETPETIPEPSVERVPRAEPPRPRALRMPQIPSIYPAVALSIVAVIIVFYAFGAGLGFFAAQPSEAFVFSLEQQQVNGLQGFLYGVKNIDGIVEEVIIRAELPAGSEVRDPGGAEITQKENSIILTWLVSRMEPNEKRTFSFSGRVPGKIKLFAEGLAEKEEKEISDKPIQAKLHAGKYEYKRLDIRPIGYLGEIGVSLSAGPEGTVFTEETVTVPEMPINNITENITTVIVNETENLTKEILEENKTENATENITEKIEENVTEVAQKQNATQENITETRKNISQEFENATETLEIPSENISEISKGTPPTGGAVIPPAEPRPITNVKVFLDPDNEINGNEDLIGEISLTGEWEGTFRAAVPEEKYTENINLVFYSENGAVVLVKSVNFKWIVKVKVNASEEVDIIEELYENITEENVTNVTEIEVNVVDASGKTIDAEVFLEEKKGKFTRELPKLAETEKHKFEVEKEKYNIKIKPKDSPIKEIILNDVEIKESITIGIDDVPESIEMPEGTEWVEVYAIDTSGIEFSSAKVTVEAKGNTLYKCKEWEFKERECKAQQTNCEESENETECNSGWEYLMDIIPKKDYTFTLTPEDPAFAESSEAVDVALAPITDTSFVVAWVDKGEKDVSFKVMDANGSIIVDTVDVDTTVNVKSRVSAAAINSTHFAIAWFDKPEKDITRAIYKFDGSNVFPATDVDTNVGTKSDVSVAQLGDRFVICYANDDDNDADFKIYDNEGAQLVGETRVDGNMQPQSNLNNLIECAGINSTRWVYFWFDDKSNDATFRIVDNNGDMVTGQVDIDNNVGEHGQVAVTALDNNKFAMVWYDSKDDDITIAIRDVDNNVILAPTDVVQDIGPQARVAIAAVRENSTATSDSFVVAWWEQVEDDPLRVAVYSGSGEQITAPFYVDMEPDEAYRLIDVVGRDPITGNSLCPGTFVIAYTNSSDMGVFKGFYINGTEWDGRCKVDTAPPAVNLISPVDGSVDTTGISTLKYTVVDAESNVSFCELLINGTVNQTDETIEEGVEQEFANVSELLDGYYAWSVRCTDTAGNVGVSEEWGFIVNRSNMTGQADVGQVAVTIDGEPVNISIKFYDSGTGELDYEGGGTNYSGTVNKGVYDIEVTFENFTIGSVMLHEVNVSQDLAQLINITDLPEDNVNSLESFEIDTMDLEFNNGTVNVDEAKGWALYKCVNWDHVTDTCAPDICPTLDNCTLSWVKVVDTVPGEPYNFTITPEDPGYFEANNLGDALVYEGNPNTNYGTLSFLGVRSAVSQNARTYIAFDNFSAINESIEAAEFCMYYYRQTGDGTRTVGVHHVFDSQGQTETTVTWNNQPCGTGFDNATACNLTAEDNETINSTVNVWHCWDVTHAVKQELQSNSTNVFFAVKDSQESSATANEQRFYSRNYANSSLHPKLNITLAEPPQVTDPMPEPGEVFVRNSKIAITVTVVDNVAVDKVYANVSWNNSFKYIELTDPDGNTVYEGLFENTSQTGTYNISYFANDTSGYVNNTTTTYFVIKPPLTKIFLPPSYANLTDDPSASYGDGDVSANVTIQVSHDNVTCNQTACADADVRENSGNYATLDSVFTNSIIKNGTSITGVEVQVEGYYTPLFWIPEANSIRAFMYYLNESVWVPVPGCQNVRVPATVNDKLCNLTDLVKTEEQARNISLRIEFNESGSGIPAQARIWIDFENLSIEYTDVQNPSVTDVKAEPSVVLQGEIVNISANITDNYGVEWAEARVTYPNSTFFDYNMTHAAGDIWYCEFNDTYLIGDYNVTIRAYDTSNNLNNTEKTNFTVLARVPQWSSVSQNNTAPGFGEAVKLSAYWTDSGGLSHAVLATNETGQWENKTSEGRRVFYSTAGTSNGPIRGSRNYASCGNISLLKPFSYANMSAVVDLVNSGGDIWLELRNDSAGAPGSVVLSCDAPDPTGTDETVFCDGYTTTPYPAGNYWMCVYSANGTETTTYFNVNYGADSGYHAARNESGSWAVYSGYSLVLEGDFRLYDSPQTLVGTGDWSNFTWSNSSVLAGTVIGWRIYANNTLGNENVTDVMTFTVAPTVLISLITNTVDFGAMGTNSSNSTSDNSPAAFEIRNDGNVKVNITINGTDLFAAAPNPSSAYQFAANSSSEGTNYDPSCSITNWSNMPSIATLFMCFLDWVDTNDQAEVEIKVSVPIDEPPGSKTSTVTFIASQA